MSLHLHRALRADALADGLGRLLTSPLPDPFARELVVVPARGMERWLSQRLSHALGAGQAGDGVCAAVDFRSPGSLVAEVTGTRDDDPWAPDALAWPVLEVLDASLDEPWAATLARHLGHSDNGEEADLRLGRRFSVARRLAGLFASYAGQRPGLVADWSAGRDTDGAGAPIAPDLAWQPELWRRLVARVDAASPVERHLETVHRLVEDPEAFDLPTRLSLFGHTRLSVTEIGLLDALGREREVHVWLPHPSPAVWEALRGRAGAVPRSDDDSHRVVGHPLLAGLGRDTRELQRALAAADIASDTAEAEPAAAGDAARTAAGRPRGRCGRGRRGGSSTRPTVRCRCTRATASPGRSTSCARCCSGCWRTTHPRAARRPGDVSRYRDLCAARSRQGSASATSSVSAVTRPIGCGSGWPTGRPCQTNPLLGVARSLLDIAGGSAPATQVLDLARSEPVRRRFGFTDDDLEQLDTWVRESGVRWAFDAAHRADFGLTRLRREHLGVRARPAPQRRRSLRRLLRLARPGPAAGRRRQRTGRPRRSARRVRRRACATSPTGSPAPTPSTTGSRRSTRGSRR